MSPGSSEELSRDPGQLPTPIFSCPPSYNWGPQRAWGVQAGVSGGHRAGQRGAGRWRENGRHPRVSVTDSVRSIPLTPTQFRALQFPRRPSTVPGDRGSEG